jgi:hypothetical protein
MSSFWKRFAAIVGGGTGVAALPFFASLGKIEPPWPPHVGILSSVVILVIALLMWFGAEHSRTSRKRARRPAIVWPLLALVLGLVGYLVLLSMFTEAVPGEERRLVRGFTCNQDSLDLHPQECPHVPVFRIDQALWDEFSIWTPWSITLVRMALLLTWFLFLGGLVSLIGLVAARNRKGGRSISPGVSSPPAGT